MAQVIVELRNEYNSVVARTRSDGSGRYYFSGLSHGRYTVRVMPLGTGYMEQSEDVELSGVGARGAPLAENAQKDVYLRLRNTQNREPLKNEVIFAQEVPRDAEKLYRNAVEDIDSNRVVAGIATLENAVAVFPTYFAALQRLAYVRLMQEKFSDAEALFERALAVNTNSFESNYGLAIAQAGQKKNRQAIVSAEKAITRKPDSYEAYLLIGMTHRQEKQYEASEKALKQAIKVAEEGVAADAHWNLALLYAHNLGRFGDAAKELDLFLKISPDAPNKEAIKKLIKEFKEKAKTSKS